MAGGAKFEERIRTILNSKEMKDDLLKDKSSQFNKNVRMAIERLIAIKKNKISPIRQKIKKAIAEGVGNVTFDEILGNKKPKDIIKMIDKEVKILTNYRDKTLKNKKYKKGEEIPKIDIDKKSLIEILVAHAERWKVYCDKTQQTILDEVGKDFQGVMKNLQEVTSSSENLVDNTTTILQNIKKTIAKAMEETKDPKAKHKKTEDSKVEHKETEDSEVEHKETEDSEGEDINMDAVLTPLSGGKEILPTDDDVKNINEAEESLQKTKKIIDALIEQTQQTLTGIDKLTKSNSAAFKKMVAKDFSEIKGLKIELMNQQKQLEQATNENQEYKNNAQKKFAKMNQQGSAL